MYTVRKVAGNFAGWAWKNGKYRRVVRIGSVRGHIDETLTSMCRNLAGHEFREDYDVDVWKIQLLNENLNKTVYYAYAKSEQQVRDYAEKVLLARLLKKESGMAKYAIGIAAARVSNRSEPVAPSGSKQFRMAYEASFVEESTTAKEWANGGAFSPEYFWMQFTDNLRYSQKALKGGAAALDNAIMKAANKTAGLIHVAYANFKFDQDVKTPFPEIVGKR